MIIEIKDLPYNKAIKHINIDIMFDDLNQSTVKVIGDNIDNANVKHDMNSNHESSIAYSDKPSDKPANVQVRNDDRPSIPVPSEMLDAEF